MTSIRTWEPPISADQLNPCWPHALSDTGITENLIGYKGQQMLIATDASNRPVFDNSAEPDLVAWTMERGFRRRKRVHQFINLEFVNTKLVIDKAEVKVRGMHTFELS